MAEPSTSPEAAVVARLTGQYGLTSGTNLFSGPERMVGTGIPGACVFVATYGGPAPIPYLGNQADQRTFSVQVLVRGDPDTRDAALVLARQVWNRLHRSAPSGYIDCLCDQSGPVDLGMGNDDRPRFSINVYLRYSG